jgi:hypothetical protein
MKFPFAAGILVLAVFAPGACLGLGLSDPAQSGETGPGETAVAQSPSASTPEPAAPSLEPAPSLSTLAQEVEELQASRKRATIGVLLASVTAIAAGIGLYLVADEQLETAADQEKGELKFARGSGAVCVGLGLVALFAAGGP